MSRVCSQNLDEHDDLASSASLDEPQEDPPAFQLFKGFDPQVQSRQVFKSEEYRRLFHLPAEEVLIQDFNCALQKKILLQGHMYLFERYVCFYSNIFGYEKKKVIPLKDVTCVQKAKTAGLFPNAIEMVSWGKKIFFASFLSRDEAFRLIFHGWCQHSSHSRQFLELENALCQTINPSIPLLSSDTCQDTQPSSLSESSFGSRDMKELRDAPASVDIGADGVEESEVLEQIQTSTALRMEDTKISNSSVACHSSYWEVEQKDAPELPSHYRTIMESEFLIDVQEFFKLFFSNEAVEFLKAFHRKCGDEDLQCTKWTKHRHFGHVRDVSFRHPINYYFGPKGTYCQEVQRYRVYQNSHLIIETSQQMNDIPYGDYFRVEGRWDIERVEGREGDYCVVRISVDVPFSKNTVWKGKIEQGTFDECNEACSTWVLEARKLLQENRMVDDRTVSIEGISQAVLKYENCDSALDSSIMRPINKPGNNNTASNNLKKSKGKTELKNLVKAGDFTQGHRKVVKNSANTTSSQTCREDRFRGNEKMVGQEFLDSVRVSPSLNQPQQSTAIDSKAWKQIKLLFLLCFMVITVLTQVGIIIALTRSSKMQYIPVSCSRFEEEFSRSCMRGQDTEKSVAWLKQRARLLQEEVAMAESRMQTLQHDLVLIKTHMQTLQTQSELDLGLQNNPSSS